MVLYGIIWLRILVGGIQVAGIQIASIKTKKQNLRIKMFFLILRRNLLERHKCIMVNNGFTKFSSGVRQGPQKSKI